MNDSPSQIPIAVSQKNQQPAIVDLLIVFACNIPIFLPLLNGRFFWSHENAYFLWRVVSFHQNVVDGMPFCRWFPDFARGFGLPFLEYYPVLPLYLTEIFKLTGASTINSIKLLIVVITLLAAWGAWLLGKEIWGRTGGLVTACLFSFAPYKMVNLFVRGDINEYAAMAAAPWILWLITRSAGKDIRHPVCLATTIAFCVPALSHYPSCVLQYPLYTFWILCLALSAKQPRRFLIQNLLALGAALLLTSTFWASAFLSRDLVQMEGMTQGFADYRQHFIAPLQWFSWYWNFGASVRGPGDAISFQIGNVAFIATLIGLPGLIILFKRPDHRRAAIWCAVPILALSLFLTHHSSAWVWSVVPVLPMIQFAYRILAIPALMIALLGGAAGFTIEHRIPRYRILATAVVILMIVIVSLRMCRVAGFMQVSESELRPSQVRRAAHTHCTGEYIPRAVGKRFPPPVPITFTLEKIPEDGFSREQTEARLKRWLTTAAELETWEGETIRIGNADVRPGEIDVIAGKASVVGKEMSACSRNYLIRAETPVTLRFNQFYFQGWRASLDTQPATLKPDPDTGLILVEIPSGEHSLLIAYHNLPLSEKLGVISLLTAVLLIISRLMGRIRHE